MPCLYLLSQIRMNKLRLLIGGGVSPIADGRLFFSPRPFLVEERLGLCDPLHVGVLGPLDVLLLVASPVPVDHALLCTSGKIPPLSPAPLGC